MTAPSRPSAEVAADSPGGIRTLGADHRFAAVSVQSVARRARTLRGGEPISILALSGGGADGAFGAGALVGLTNAGARPQFSVVTGVSAGALLAPYAFLGSEWDKQLTDSYTSGRAEHLLQSRGLGVIFDSSVYRGRPLEELVDHYLSDELIQAVAREAAAGRLLLVATTNVDTGETVIWDLGSIAMNGSRRWNRHCSLLRSTHLVAAAPGSSQSPANHGVCPRRWTIESRAKADPAALQADCIAEHFCGYDSHDEDDSGADRNHRTTAGSESSILGDSRRLPEPGII
jgi:hypothetical protein